MTPNEFINDVCSEWQPKTINRTLVTAAKIRASQAKAEAAASKLEERGTAAWFSEFRYQVLKIATQ